MQTDIQQAQAFEKLFPTYTGSMTALIEKSFSGVHLQSSVLTQKTEPLEGFLADLATAQGFKRGDNVLHRRIPSVPIPLGTLLFCRRCGALDFRSCGPQLLNHKIELPPR